MSGIEPKPASGVEPKPASGVEPKPASGREPKPASGVGPGSAGQPLAEARAGGAAARASTAIATLPNAITLARLLLMPVCAWLLATGRWGTGSVLTGVVGATDWVDGWLARRTRQVSRLGQLMDPFADRLLIGSVAVALLVRGVLPWPVVALLVGRDVLLLAAFPLLSHKGVRPPDVVWVGKAATFVLLFALPTLVVGATGLAAAPAFRVAGLAAMWLGVALYYVAGAVYVRMVIEGLRAAGARS